MTSPNATPRPWRYTEGTNGQIRLMLGKGAYQLVYNVVGELNRLAEKANAHEELVAALRDASPILETMAKAARVTYCGEESGPRDPLGPLCDRVRALLARIDAVKGGE